jgi:hypothetical protein
LNVRLGIDNVGDLGKRRIAGPDFSVAAFNSASRVLFVAAYRGIASLGDMPALVSESFTIGWR